MKILVYGAGAIGSLLTHFLIKAGNDVTVVARSTAEVLEKEGLVIEHYLQRHKVTVDRPVIITKASYDEEYDIVFSVMQGQQQLTVLGELTKVNTKLIVMVGKAFAVRGYRITEVSDMQAYYYYHVAEIMPYILMCYKVDCDLKKLKRNDIKRIVTASGECFEYLKSVGISVMPVGEDKLFQKGIMGYATFLLYRLMSRTVLGKLMVADHARNGVAENQYIDAEFEKFRTSHPGSPCLRGIASGNIFIENN